MDSFSLHGKGAGRWENEGKGNCDKGNYDKGQGVDGA